MSPSEPAPSNGTEENETEASPRDLTQWLGVLMVLVALGLIIAGSIGVAQIEGSLARFLLIAGLVASAGREAVRALAGRYTS